MSDFDLFNYPDAAGFKREGTSSEAARAMTVTSASLRWKVLNELRKAGPLTADECAARLEIDKLSIRPRFSELSNLDKIADTGERRRNDSKKRAIVWCLKGIFS